MSPAREDRQRALVVEVAMRWLLTPYHHGARLKGVGVDCAQLPIAVYGEAGLIDPPSPRYVRDWHLNRNEEVFVEWVLRYAREIDRDQVGPGDLGLWRYGRTFSHAAIAVAPPLMIHAHLNRNVELVDMSGDEDLRTREARFFTLWGT